MEQAELIAVLQPYVRINKVLGDRISCYCPFPHDAAGRLERNPSMSIYTKSGRVICFACGYRASVAKFLEDRGMNRDTARQYRDVFRDLKREEKAPTKTVSLAAWVGFFRRFYPKNILDLGYRPETLDRYEVGYDTRYQRVTYPVRDRYGNLIAIVGGAITQDDFPKYKLYDEEVGLERSERQDHRNHLWGFHLIPPDAPYVVVEGYKACMWLDQAGINACCTQGIGYTKAQLDLMVEECRPVAVMYDNDGPGKTAGMKLAGDLISRIGNRARLVRYPRPVKQPDDLTVEELQELLAKERKG